MSQIQQFQCDHCDKTAELNAVDGWWILQISPRQPLVPPAGAGNPFSGAGAFAAPVPPVIPVGGDVCSAECAIAMVTAATELATPPTPAPAS